jgi:DNA-binding MarR family transcriptional regulator
MKNLDLHRFLSYRLDLVSESAAAIVSQIYEREVQLTLRELRVLRTVGSTPGIAHSEMVAKVLFEKSLVSRLVSGLVKRAYLKRSIDPSDARRLPLMLTKKGAAILERADQLGLAMNDVWLSVLTKEEQKNLTLQLDKLTSGLDQLARRFDVSPK